MQLISLDQVFKILKPGVPLPFGIRDAEGRLLLSKGHVVPDQEKLVDLLNRGMFVEAEEARRSVSSAREPEAPEQQGAKFSARWEAMLGRLGLLLRSPGDPEFLKQIQELAGQVCAFPESQNDQILFLTVRHDHSRHELYPEAHALHAAALCHLVSRRLGWPEGRRHSLVGAALTMNMSMVHLQAKLAGQQKPLTPPQRKEIQAHPLASVALLQSAGLRDEDWLAAVAQHHESLDGTGYPQQTREAGELAQLLRLVDVYTAKHSARANRVKQPAQLVAKELYAQSGGNPLMVALLKECGIYPPGCYVKLAGGETAIVTRRGATAKEPMVAIITNANGEPLSRPALRDTSAPARAIIGTLAEKSVLVHVSADQLYS